ncbi:diguanylate cyclase [Sphingomonas sp. IW22]|uniref:sensor domain-containing diguanylate cyclase n=1 Tax=Sphingomonas sp. IW22 TaxID=3242489 RepID=UPI003521A972
MFESFPGFPRRAIAPLVTGVVYYFAAVIALSLAGGPDEIGMIWPPSGILFAAMLASGKGNAQYHLATAGLASLIANLQADNTAYVSVAFTVANLVESAFGAWLLRSRFRSRVSFNDPKALIYFCVAATASTAVGATTAALLAPATALSFWLNWFSTDLLGVLIVTPMILIIGRELYRSPIRTALRSIPKALLVFATVALAGLLAFFQDSYPLLSLPMLAVLFASLALGPLGAAVGVLIVASISTVALVFGQGPIVTVYAESLVRSLFLQLYLLVLFAGALPVAALLAARKQLLERLAQEMRLLQLAESAAQVGHWRLEIATNTLTWSDEVYRIHGLTRFQPATVESALAAYHPEDVGVVTAHLNQSIAEGREFEFTARIIRPDGEVRHVFSKGEIDRGDGDHSAGLFGIIRDITAQVVHESALTDARAKAENAAREATILAETDQLTGISNRRKTTFVLDEEVRKFEASGKPLSVVSFDIDHFKRVNDSHGHHIGDEVIVRVAARAASELRRGDLIGRMGGEEFLILLPEATSQAALAIAERVRLAIESEMVEPRVTISAGVGVLQPGEAADAVLRRADRALYVAKEAGRNAVKLAEPS